MLQTPVSAAGSLSAERRGRQSSGPPVARAGFGDLAVLITSQPSLETKYFFPWIRCTIKEIMKIYALLGILMRVERRTTFDTSATGHALNHDHLCHRTWTCGRACNDLVAHMRT